MKTSLPPLPNGVTFCTGLDGQRVCTGSMMGRSNILSADRHAKVKLRLVRLKWVDGDYDQGGAYWGSGNGDDYIYRGTAEGVEVFVRAEDRGEAAAKVRAFLPNASFFNEPPALDTFTRSYLIAALWSSTNDEGDPFDDKHSIATVSRAFLVQAVKDCKAFREANGAALAGIEDGRAGHCFWLDRNHHGAGFKDEDRDRETMETLCRSAQTFRELYLYEHTGRVYAD